MASKKRKVLNFILISLGGITIGLLLSFYLSLRFSTPKTSGSVKLSGLTDSVEIVFDKMGIPQIMASNETDACFALGYQHAADRLFQMDLTRRLASGKLSELFGELSREIDKDQRRIGHSRLARKAVSSLSKANRKRLQAYADGVNRYVETCGALPFEYRFLPADFEPWTIEDCLTILSFQTWYSNGLMSRDRFYAKLTEQISEERAASLLFPYPEWGPYTVKDNSSTYLQESGFPDSVFRMALPEITGTANAPETIRSRMFKRLFADNRLPFTMTESSNAWVVGPEKSESGFPLLASDPHLDITRLPQFWYGVGVHFDDRHLFGITAPGLPFVVMGANGTAGWAFTAGGTDLTDYYIVALNPENSRQYRSDSGWVDFTEIRDSIRIIGQDQPDQLTFYVTEKTVQLKEEPEAGKAVMLYWTGFDADLNKAVSNAFALHQVESYDQFRTIVTGLGALDANYLYADVNGTIGYQLSAPLIERIYRQSTLPIHTTNLDKPKRFYPLDLTPHSDNPSDGFLASCNNRPSNAPNYRGHYFATRILRINELLHAQESFNAEDMKTFQQDLTDSYLLRFKDDIADVLRAIGKPEEEKIIRFWNGSTDKDARAPAIINLYLMKLKELTFDDELGELYRDVPDRWIEHWEKVSQAGWFDNVITDTLVETYDDITREAMTLALNASGGKTWGEIHTMQMQHPLAIIPVINSWLGLTGPEEPWRGTGGTLNASFFYGNETTGFHSLAGPSMRLIIDFASPNEVAFTLPAGNCGNPMSNHFFDFYPLWKKGEYWKISLDPETIKATGESTLILEPF